MPERQEELVAEYLYALIIYPLEMFIETVFSISMDMIPGVGYAILFVSLAVQLLAFPMYKRADELQEEERDRQKAMDPTVKHIKKTFKGEERVMMLSTYYREEHYHTYYQLKAILPLMLQIPFFIAAYNFLSTCKALDGASFYFLRDMGKPDAMLNIGGITVNVMPIAMTLINIVSGMIYTRGLAIKDKVQLYLTAGVFLVLLYDSPSGLVFYWTLNNVFSLLKNIFMKLVKHPREIISVGVAIFTLGYCYKCYTYGNWATGSGKIVMILVFLIGMIPLVNLLFEKFRRDHGDSYNQYCDICVDSEQKRVFRIAGVIMALTTGLLIPVIAMATSPTEFVIRGHYVNPLMQVLYSFTVAVGIFVLWGNIIFSFYSERAKKILCFGFLALAVCGLINSLFFKKYLGNMSAHMQYSVHYDRSSAQIIINTALMIVAAIICYGVYKYGKKTTLLLCYSIVAVVAVMSVYNIGKIQKVLNETPHLKDNEYYTNNEAHFTLDKNGKNVIVFMIDRAFGPYVPYIFNEKPELADIYSGFTYYPNTISYGVHTLQGAPGLMGGYDYTTYKFKDMTGNDFEEYRKSCLNVMPTLFSDNGYKCTILDTPFGLGDESIEEYFSKINPDIDAYYALGVLKSDEDARDDFDYFQRMGRKNYIRHSIFLTAPLLLRNWLYDDGAYHMQERADGRLILSDNLSELDKLSDMTEITDQGNNTYTFMLNETPHCINAHLQMPDYTSEDIVDNSPYIEEWRNKLDETPGDREIMMYTDWAIQSYEVNMATFLRIGEWIKYLKENNLYDNTRIILVSDHGFFYFAFPDMILNKNGSESDIERLSPLLMVKDFGDGEFSISEEFMTNADVPTIAMEDLIEDPVNPNTGNPINSKQKGERVQYVYDDNNWLSVHDDMRDMNNWNIEEIEFSNKELIMSD